MSLGLDKKTSKVETYDGHFSLYNATVDTNTNSKICINSGSRSF